MVKVHPTALVDSAAELAEGVEIGPYSIIGPQVRIGARTKVDAHCVIQGHTTIGEDNHFFPFNSIGGMPQDISHKGEVTRLEIGDRNTVREYCTFNTGTFKEEGLTRIGSDNWIMAYVHVAHDCRVGNHTILANQVTLAGHVHLGDWSVIGGLTGIHQWVHVGAHAMVGFQGHVAQDVAPYMTVDGHPLTTRSVNLVGLKRRDFSADRIAVIRKMHKLLFRDGLTLEQSKEAIQTLIGQGGDEDVRIMLDFLANASRGLVR